MVEITFIWLLPVLYIVRLADDTSANVDVSLQRLGASHFEFWRNKTKFELTVWMAIEVLVALILSTRISVVSNVELRSNRLYVSEIANINLGVLLRCGIAGVLIGIMNVDLVHIIDKKLRRPGDATALVLQSRVQRYYVDDICVASWTSHHSTPAALEHLLARLLDLSALPWRGRYCPWLVAVNNFLTCANSSVLKLHVVLKLCYVVWLILLYWATCAGSWYFQRLFLVCIVWDVAICWHVTFSWINSLSSLNHRRHFMLFIY